MSTIYFVFRPTRGRRGSSGSIFMRLIHQRKTRTVTIAKDIMSFEWDSKNQCVILPEADNERNTFLKKISKTMADQKSIVTGIITSLEKQGYYTVDEILDRYTVTTENGTLLSYTGSLAKELDRNNQTRTADAYRTCATGFVNFTGNRKFKLSHINNTIIKQFENDMKKRGKAPNAISYYMRNLRAIYNKAVSDKRIREKSPKPFDGVFTGFHKTTKRALSAAELEKFFAVGLQQKLAESRPGTKEHEHYGQLYKAWRMFFFCFYCQGLCFVDLSYLKKENIRGGVLTYYRRKTGQLIDIKVTDDMQYIIDSFRDETSGTPYLFPIITDSGKDERTQYMNAMRMQNRRLGELSELAGLERKVTTHVVRHTYATLLKRNNLPVGVISQSLGHTTEKTTSIYLDSLDRSVIDQANEKVTAPFQLVPRNAEMEADYEKRIVDLLQSHITDSDKAQMIYPILKDIFRIMEVSV